MDQKNLNKLISEALAIEEEAARGAGALGFMTRALVQATMPHSKIQGNEFIRRNGNYTMTMLAPTDPGLPYGAIPRLIMSWMTTEAVKTKSRQIVLGDTLSEFMRELDMVPTGGRWGTITRLKNQMERLFSASVSCYYRDDSQTQLKNINIVSKAKVWWDPVRPNQGSLWQSTVTLGEDFFAEMLETPIPIDLRALKALKRSPLALDIYCWLTYRMSYLKHKTNIPWQALQMQFGSNYSNDAKGTRNFKLKFLEAYKKVSLVYPEAKVDSNSECLILKPSKPHIARVYQLNNKHEDK